MFLICLETSSVSTYWVVIEYSNKLLPEVISQCATQTVAWKVPKSCWFDCLYNCNDSCGRSQVKSNFRTAITVPEKCWVRFRDILADYCDKMARAQLSPDPMQVSVSTTATDGAIVPSQINFRMSDKLKRQLNKYVMHVCLHYRLENELYCWITSRNDLISFALLLLYQWDL